MLYRATQDRRVMVERSDRMWSTGGGNGKPLQYSCLENPVNSMKRQKDRTLKNELPRSVQFSSVQSLSRVRLFATPRIAARQASLFITISRSSLRLMICGEITPERMKRWSQSKNNTQLWMWLVIEASSDPVKSNIA